MKKIYLLFALLLSFLGVTQVVAQDDDAVVLEISKRNGNWTASGSPAYANEFATKEYSAEKATPGVRIQHWDRGGGHRNNMYFWDGVNLGIYSAFGSTTSEDYRIYPSKGYYVYGISLDFIPGKHKDYPMNGVRVWANGEEDTAVTSPDAENDFKDAALDDAELSELIDNLPETEIDDAAIAVGKMTNEDVPVDPDEFIGAPMESVMQLVEKYVPDCEETANID